MSFSGSYVLPTYARFPLQAVKGEGARLWDDQGKSYLDFCMGIATCSLGHCHPLLSEAIAEQAKTLMHCSNLYHTAGQTELARIIVEDFQLQPGKIFFSNSGAEANDGMIKTARRFGHAKPNSKGDARYEVITFNLSFHGRTLGSMAATAQPKIHEGFDPLLPGFRYVPFNDIAALKDAINDTTAGIMLEPIQGEGGVNEAQPEFLKAVSELCKEHDLLLMFDEVQCGFGRTGTLHGWQSICPELQPDTISWAKGMGGGFPIGCFYTSDRSINENETPLSSIMGAGSHGSTYGGNPLACAASTAVLKEILNSNLIENVRDRETQIRETVNSWKHAAIHSISGKGLLLGFKLNTQVILADDGSTSAAKLCSKLMDAGLLTVPAGPETLRWLPPLNVTESEVAEALTIFKNTLDSF